MHVRVDRVVQIEGGPENGAYDLPDVGVDKVQGYIAGLSGGHARDRRWWHGRWCGAGCDKGTLAAAINGDRTVYSRLGGLQAARLFQWLQTRLRGKLTVGQYDGRDGEEERWNGTSKGRHYRCWRCRAGRGSAPGLFTGRP